MEYPLPSTPLVNTLQQEVGLIPGCPFRGAVATFAGYKDKPHGVTFLELIHSDCVRLCLTGNDHRALGLWGHGIPTLYEYNQFMTPCYYAALSRLLSRPGDRQLRNVILLTQPNCGYLRSLGIRYLVTDCPESMSGSVRVEAFPLGESGCVLFLCELGDPNLGCYSPTHVRVVANAQETLSQLAQEDFDYRQEALATTEMSESLVPASNVQMTMHRGHVLVQANSSGTSLLLLPLQYSHCLELEPIQESEECKARLVRLNLLQAGLVFSGSLQARLRFASGPFRNPYGRLRDYWDMRTLRLAELCQQPPPSQIASP